ncbi:aromatic amino acid DMT transporter YddG [Acinetobacter puyangensis]|uniref:aromatic amino acid DMT transporter YddG n=1 Tax=Acinetobacter puyangensis TaxID=1096779 RepID=UPI003A4E01DE
MPKNLATVIGLSAVVMWASMVGLVKYVSAIINPLVGITLIYSFSAILVLMMFKLPNFRLISKTYLLLSTILFVAFELCFSFAIAYSQTSQQAIEVSIINYLWPSLTVLAFVIFKELKFNVLIILGLLLSMSGIIFIQTGAAVLSLSGLINNFQGNPISYILALSAAIIWSAYCVVTKKMSRGQNPISVFFIVVALTLWLKLLLVQPFTFPTIDFSTFVYILLAAAAVGLGYAAWNIGIIHGNISILIIASYFTPVISSVMAMWILDTALSMTFWQGTGMVILGSLICWMSTNWNAIRPFFRKKLKKLLQKS